MNITKMTKEQRLEAMRKSDDKLKADIALISSKDCCTVMDLNSIPKTYVRLWVKNALGETTRNNAIKLKCLDCCCYQREEVANCEITSCALFKFRPYKSAQID